MCRSIAPFHQKFRLFQFVSLSVISSQITASFLNLMCSCPKCAASLPYDSKVKVLQNYLPALMAMDSMAGACVCDAICVCVSKWSSWLVWSFHADCDSPYFYLISRLPLLSGLVILVVAIAGHSLSAQAVDQPRNPNAPPLVCTHKTKNSMGVAAELSVESALVVLEDCISKSCAIQVWRCIILIF